MWYHVSYDIRDGKDEDYEELFKHIRKYSAYSHILKSSWIISSTKSAITIRDELTNSISATIDVLITVLGGNDAASLAPGKINYLVKNLGWTSS